MRQEAGPFSRPRAAGQRNALGSGKIPAQVSSPLAACLGHTASSPAAFPKPLRWPKPHGHPRALSLFRTEKEGGMWGLCAQHVCVREREREGGVD